MTVTPAGWVRRAGFDAQLERPCEIIELDVGHAEGPRRLDDIRRIAAAIPSWTQTVVRIEDDRPGWVRVTTTAIGGTQLLAHLSSAPLHEALLALDRLLIALEDARRSSLTPHRLTHAVVGDGHVALPLVDFLRGSSVGGLRPDLCAILGALGSRADVPERVHGVLEAFDRDLFEDVGTLRAALTRATTPWSRRHRHALAAAMAILVTLTLALAYAAWTREPPLDDVIKDDLNARVEQMHALSARSEVVPHGRGPDLAGAWWDRDDAPTSIRPVGDPAAGRWSFESGTLDRAPDSPGYWRHHGVLTLRSAEGRYFLTGTLDRDPGDPEAWVEVELELEPDETLRLRSSVFHDPGVGYSFAYFLGSFRRVR